MPKEKMYSMQQLAEILEVEPTTVHSWKRSGKITATAIGHKYYVDSLSLMTFLSNNTKYVDVANKHRDKLLDEDSKFIDGLIIKNKNNKSNSIIIDNDAAVDISNEIRRLESVIKGTENTIVNLQSLLRGYKAHLINLNSQLTMMQNK